MTIMLSTEGRRDYVKLAVSELGALERFACRILGQPQTTQCIEPRTPDDEAALTAKCRLASEQEAR